MNKKHVFGVTALALLLTFSFTGCKTITTLDGGAEKQGGVFQTVQTPAKDFNTLGLVFAEVVEEKDDKGVRGDILTYQALLKEVKKLNGDYMINVVIERKFEGKVELAFGNPQKDTEIGKSTWYGSAVAIKYTASLTESSAEQIISPNGQPVTRTVTKPVMNDERGGGGILGGGSGKKFGDGFKKLFKR